MTRIGVYFGTSSDQVTNVEKEIIAWGDYLSDYELEAFGSANLPPSVEKYYNQIETKERNASVPYMKILSTYFDCREYINKRSPDLLIQIWKYNTHAPGVTLAGHVNGIPTVTRCSGDVYNSYTEFNLIKKPAIFLLNNILNANITLRFSDQIIAFGPYTESELIKRGVKKETITILPPAKSNDDRFSPPDDKKAAKRKLGFPLDIKTVLYVGRITKLKGMDFMEKVIKSMPEDSKTLFILVGSGPYKEKLQNKFGEDKVRAVGFIPYQDIHEYYQASDVYIHTSPLEGIPLTILEALQCNVPVIAREAGDIKFITGKTVNSPKEMKEALINEDWCDHIHNEKYFSEDYQKEHITSMVNSLTG